MSAYQIYSNLLRTLSHPTRLAILDTLRDSEQCVCHMEATLGLRQAYISQQLMTLKEAGLVDARREGQNLYYHVTKPEIFGLLDQLPTLTDIKARTPNHPHANASCPCPKCNGDSSKEPRSLIVAGRTPRK